MSETRDIFEMSREDAEAFLRARQQQLLPVPVKYKGGYAAVPGTGPANETCKTCRYLVRKQDELPFSGYTALKYFIKPDSLTY